MNDFGYILNGQLIYCEPTEIGAKPIIRTPVPQGDYYTWYDWIEETDFIYQFWQMEEIISTGGEGV